MFFQVKANVKREQEAFNERHDVTSNQIKRRRSTFVERDTETEEALFTTFYAVCSCLFFSFVFALPKIDIKYFINLLNSLSCIVQ